MGVVVQLGCYSKVWVVGLWAAFHGSPSDHREWMHCEFMHTNNLFTLSCIVLFFLVFFLHICLVRRGRMDASLKATFKSLCCQYD